MAHEWKGNEKVRRTSARGCESAHVATGTLGVVVGLYDGRCPSVRWGNSAYTTTYGYYDDLFPLACLELVEPATPPAEPPPGVVRELENLKQQIAPVGLIAELTKGKLTVADIIAERDRLRAEKADLLVSVAYLERENIRLTGKLKGSR